MKRKGEREEKDKRSIANANCRVGSDVSSVFVSPLVTFKGRSHFHGLRMGVETFFGIDLFAVPLGTSRLAEIYVTISPHVAYVLRTRCFYVIAVLSMALHQPHYPVSAIN
jgi:hypothetical protein